MIRKLVSAPSVLTFSFLLSGSIVHKLYYGAGNSLVCYALVSLILLVFMRVSSRYFLKRKVWSEIIYNKKIAMTAVFFMIFSISFTVSQYLSALGTFAEYYSEFHVAAFALLSVLLSGYIMADKGKIALCGYSRMTSAFCALWILSGVLGFFYTRNIAVSEPFREEIVRTDFGNVALNAALISFDTVLLLVMLFDDVKKDEGKALTEQMFCGTVMFVVVSGINVLKNILLFGDAFMGYMDNPDLAAIRLIPMFELPEVSVVVNTIAVSMRIAVYFCAGFYLLRNKEKAEKDNRKITKIMFGVIAVMSLCFSYGPYAYGIGIYVAAFGGLLGAISCFFVFRAKKQNDGDGI